MLPNLYVYWCKLTYLEQSCLNCRSYGNDTTVNQGQPLSYFMCPSGVFSFEAKYSRMDQVKLNEDSLYCVRYFLRNFYSPPNDRPSKTVKDVFYFI